MYKLNDLLKLFELTYDISIDDLKRAKKKVLMTHPDKSKLDAKYFLFYKSAFDIIVKFYEEQNKHNKTTTKEDLAYNAGAHNTLNKSSSKQVSSVLDKMTTNDFQNKFNELFDKNITNKPDASRNAWFENHDNEFEITENVNAKNMGEVLNKIKDTQSSMTRYKGVEHLYMNSNSGNKLYEDENDDEYVSTDPFSKLKFEDLRKVHKDQTVFAVSERDIDKVPQYGSVDQYMRTRGKQDMNPLEKTEAERILAEENKVYQQQMMQKEYDSQLKSMENVEKNKGFLSNFLRLT
tara:strand:+ start:5335 stop:6210 length:876 start_codon:yes stop_codon:yes gene_type:complete